MEKEVIIATILRKLFWMRKIGKSHTPFSNLPKGFPKDMWEEVRNIGKELIKKNYILSGKHNYGLGISLNPRRLKDITKIIEKIYSDFKRFYFSFPFYFKIF